PFRNIAINNQVALPDVARQSTRGFPLVLADQLLNFDGAMVNAGGGGFVAPPDTNGAVGLTQYLQIVNLAFSVYDKSGNLIAGPSVTKSLWAPLGGDCATRNDGDPVVLYDRMADRWFISQFTIGPLKTGSGNFYQCMAVSTSGDATGTYNMYAFNFGPDDL